MIIKKPIIFFDLETTGVNTVKDRIVQIAILKINVNGEQETTKRLLNPGIEIPKEATEIHGISNEMVKDEPTFNQVAKSLFEILDGCDICGYNSDSFDVPLLMEEFNRAGIEYPAPGAALTFIDVLKLERKLNSHKLADTYKRYTGRELEGAHDALNDVIATQEILFKQLERFNKPLDAAGVKAIYQNESAAYDLAGKMYKKEDAIYWAFGKHKDKKVLDDLQYCDWVLRSDFSIDTKNKIKTLLNGKK